MLTVEEIRDNLVTFREQIVQMEETLPLLLGAGAMNSLRVQYTIVHKLQEELRMAVQREAESEGGKR